MFLYHSFNAKKEKKWNVSFKKLLKVMWHSHRRTCNTNDSLTRILSTDLKTMLFNSCESATNVNALQTCKGNLPNSSQLCLSLGHLPNRELTS